MLKKVLIPTDGSENSLRAAEYTVKLLRLNPEIEVTVFNVVNVPRRFVARKLFWVAAERGKAAASIEELFEEERAEILNRTMAVLEKEGFTAATAYRKGNPAEEICEYARDGQFDLIVMGTRGASGIQEILIGSVSHKVLQMAPCPVILVK